MQRIGFLLAGGLTAGALLTVDAGMARAVTSKECSAKYKAAKADGSLNGMKYKEFRTKECGSVTPAKASSRTSASSTKAPAMASSATAGTGTAVFPSVVDPKYSKETAGKARMHTCLDQYHANKAGNGNGGMHWIQKGGGYYSACSKKLKG